MFCFANNAVERVKPITLFNNPWVWLKDKKTIGFEKPGLYLIALIPGVLSMIGFVANLDSLFGRDEPISSDKLAFALAWFLFAYGVINLFFIYAIQKAGIRLSRNNKIFNIVHKNVIEELREYQAEKKHYNNKMSMQNTERCIRHILEKFNDNYMKLVYRNKVSACIKYKVGNKLHPIRVGGDVGSRSNDPEDINDSHVYEALNEPKRKMRFIYVKDIHHTDEYENEALGKKRPAILSRANEKYSTFIAIPIRAGKLPTVKKNFDTRPDLGMIGFDMKEKYGFGNFEDQDPAFDVIAGFADLMSEPLQDLIEIANSSGEIVYENA